MTNVAIIEMNKVILFNNGILKENENGDIQEIHTYQTWKKLGYQVRKGEKAIAKFAVWKYMVGKKEEDADDSDSTENKKKGKMYMKVSAFFTEDQVDKIEREVK